MKTGKVGRPSVPVALVQDNEVLAVFLNAHVASDITGIDQGNITSTCRGKRKTAGNYNWVYAKIEEYK